MPARVANVAPCITQVTLKLVHYALLVNKLWFGLTFLKVLANFPTDKYGLDCCLEFNAKVFQLRLYKAYWNLERHLSNDNSKELAAATLRSVALNYIQRKGPQPPKTLLTAIEQLKRRSDIVITKPDKGSGVVVMDKTEYIRLLSEASVNDTNKFRTVPLERPKSKGRPPKHYHPLLNKEKILQSTVRRILPKDIADSCVSLQISKGNFLVSYDVSSLFTNVPLDETIAILAEKAFRDNWFNSTYDLNNSKEDLVDLLNVSTKGQLFQFNGALYEQIDGVAMGSPLGPLLDNVFMSSLEEKLELEGKLPDYYRRYVDDTLTVMPNITTATDFLNTLNHAHPSVSFTMKIEKDGMLPFLGTQLLNRAPRIETKVYVKPTNTGLLVHYQSHVDNRYKRSLLTTMLDREYRLSSSWPYFSEECERLKSLFSRLDYPHHLTGAPIENIVQNHLKIAPLNVF
ncbi:hypothetical protein ACROYT_G002558 [Oculina patagonica]